MTRPEGRAHTTQGLSRPVAIDLFAGAGGMSLGFEQGGFDVLAAVDHDPVHLAVYKYNFPFTAVLCSDIQDVHAEDLDSLVRKAWSTFHPDGEWDGVVDCLFGGPSCQGFSYIGKNVEDDDRNLLIYEFTRLVRELRPRSFVIENVPGLLAPRYAETLRGALARLRRAGYSVVEQGPLLLDAARYAVPQFRKRVFIVGVRTSETLPMVPVPLDDDPTVADALDDIPETTTAKAAVRGYVLDRSRSARKMSNYALTLQSPFEHEHPRAWDRNLLTSCVHATHSERVLRRFAALRPGDVDTVSNFKRLDGLGKSPTLRAGTGRDHGSFTAALPIHHRYARVITVREAARLHSYPDWFQFHATRWHGFREIGNSVPPRLAFSVADSLVRAFHSDHSTLSTLDIELGEPDLLEMSLVEAADHFGFDRSRLPTDSRLLTSHARKGKRTVGDR